jgi:hypothetical protein
VHEIFLIECACPRQKFLGHFDLDLDLDLDLAFFLDLDLAFSLEIFPSQQSLVRRDLNQRKKGKGIPINDTGKGTRDGRHHRGPRSTAYLVLHWRGGAFGAESVFAA